MKTKQLDNKIALVTGGGSGIGNAVVRRFAEEGAIVTFTDISHEAGVRTSEKLRAEGLTVAFKVADARDESEVKRLIADLVFDHGRLDIAVNNVGGLGKGDPSGGSITETSYESWKSTMDFSLSTTFLAMKYELAQMVKQGGGVIANTASTAGLLISKTSTPAYSSAKIGVLHLTRTAALQYARQNVRINAIAPGFTLTEAMTSGFSSADLEAFAEEVPMHRILEPRELANAFLFLCSDQSSGITGVVLPVDGGQSAA